MNCRTMILSAILGLSTLGAAIHPNTAKAGAKVPADCTANGGVDGDGDGFCVAPSSPSSSFVLDGPSDCDDARTDINPGQEEIFGNGDDENCDGWTAYLPSAAVIKKFTDAGNYPGSPAMLGHMIKRCDDSGVCDGTGDGEFNLDYGNVWFDGYRTSHLVASADQEWGRDGIPEIMTDADAANAATVLGGSSGFRGYGEESIKGFAGEVVDERLGAFREEMDADNAVQDGLITDLRTDVDDLDDDVDGLRTDHDDLDDRFNALVGEDGRLAGMESDIVGLQETDRIHGAAIARTQRHGSYFDGLVVGGFAGQRGVALTIDGERGELRKPFMGGGGFTLQGGADLDGRRFGGFGQVMFGSDGAGDGADTAMMVGIDHTWQLSDAMNLGFMGGYRYGASRASVVDTVTQGNALVAGAVMPVVMGDSDSHAIFQVRAWGGYEFYGSKTSDGPEPDSHFIGGLSVGFGYGTGALRN